uniref:Uncharacterized protein n=1 Tax=Anguilla anguilla TaxID=7936 RepID=A0A0E9VZT6_ANGAN
MSILYSCTLGIHSRYSAGGVTLISLLPL